MRRTLLMTAAAVLVSLTGFAHAADTPSAAPAKSWQQGLSRTDLVRQDLGAADREVIQARVDFEPGVTSPNHAHPGVEVAYVISGTFEYRLEGQAPVTLKAGIRCSSRRAWRISRRMSATRRVRSWRLISSRRASLC